MLPAMPYLYAAAICTTIINAGGPDWLYLLVLLFVWNAFSSSGSDSSVSSSSSMFVWGERHERRSAPCSR